ncbi:DNA replication/repair protein RecF [Protofrankia symbiont of Coriaria ruscifolia]|uniref:DNA replication and repair protein RecF n=1 Tax=Candidatus Protofrankia californiensis TaxID=1839754 RepID=A0A1C3PHM5_9ACTN|nr:DNA replication/repair protein RecF [Protofrankia symbiont of Coriaria ruscifolia]SBW29188.1 DNA replication and repair protein RecF [Candidatus Protofrankia californiensis]
MYLTHLSLVDFRSYPALDLLLAPGVNTFVGSNGQGKTNLLEAVGYLATLGSHRVASDAPLIREGATSAALRARIVRGDRAALVEIEIIPGRANRARLNRAPLVRPHDVLGLLAMVFFAPEDLALVKGDPAGRRRFLDDLLVARTPRLAGVLADYDKVLRQRSTLLRTAGAARRSGRAGDLRTLDVWDSHLVHHGCELLAARLGLLEALRPRVEAAYCAVASPATQPSAAPAGSVGPAGSTGPAAPVGGTELTGVEYRSTVVARVGDRLVSDRAVLEEAMFAELAAARQQEIERGVTLVGPHRDELLLSINGRPARGYASHGESWSLALALKLASFELLQDDQREPVLLLDDVFAELDANRRARLAELVSSAEQVLVTAAVEEDVPAALAGARFKVADGQVSRVG